MTRNKRRVFNASVSLMVAVFIVSCSNADVGTEGASVTPDLTGTAQMPAPTVQTSLSTVAASATVPSLPMCKSGLLALEGANEKGASNVYIACSDGSFVQQVTNFTDDWRVRSLSVSSNAQMITILRGKDRGRSEIDSLDLANLKVSTILSVKDTWLEGSQSPDGNYMAPVTDSGNAPGSIVTVSLGLNT